MPRLAPILAVLSLCLFLSSHGSKVTAFPTNFAWGTSTSAYQIEGAWNVSGKGQSWNDWYDLLENLPENQTGFVADDFYFRFKEDIRRMARLGLQHFRMSISWPRVLPNGTVDSPNPEGIDFYNQVFDALANEGVTPWVTLYHGDFPQALNWPNATGSWLNPNISDIFNDYADFCFKTFGSKVKNWITLNEPEISAWYGYGSGSSLPMRCSSSYNPNCANIGGGGDSTTEPYTAARNLILAHAKAYQTYVNHYKGLQGGQVGWTLNINFALPWNVSDADDLTAVDTYLQFAFGWFGSPVLKGDYPQVMKDYVSGGRLPTWTDDEVQLIKGAYDFIGINHYTTVYVHYTGVVGTDYGSDSRVVTNTSDIDGNPIGPVGESDWLFSYPDGMRGILNWISTNYGNPPIVVLENGFDVKGESDMPVAEALLDYKRMTYLNGYIDSLVTAVTQDGVDVRGYFVWSFMDNFEWGSFVPRFGLYYVNYDKNLTRTEKASALWYVQKTSQIQSWATGEAEYPEFLIEDIISY